MRKILGRNCTSLEERSSTLLSGMLRDVSQKIQIFIGSLNMAWNLINCGKSRGETPRIVRPVTLTHAPGIPSESWTTLQVIPSHLTHLGWPLKVAIDSFPHWASHMYNLRGGQAPSFLTHLLPSTQIVVAAGEAD